MERLLSQYEKVEKLVSDAKLDEDELKMVMAAIRFIVTSSAKYNTDVNILVEELQQIGLPKEHVAAVGKSYKDNVEKLRTKLQESMLRLPSSVVDWKVEYCLGNSFRPNLEQVSVQLKFTPSQPETTTAAEFPAVVLSSTELRTLLTQLKEAQQLCTTAAIAMPPS